LQKRHAEQLPRDEPLDSRRTYTEETVFYGPQQLSRLSNRTGFELLVKIIVSMTSCRSVIAENIRDLQDRTGHRSGLLGRQRPRNREDGIRHGQLLSWKRLTTPRSSRQDGPSAIDNL
jgi:hypothetical protein